MGKTMKAAIAHHFGKPLIIEEIPIPKIRPHQVLVQIKACGVCHTDLHAVNGDWPIKPILPLIPGHEGAGIVVEIGKEVKSIKEGDRMGIPWLHTACGLCDYCLSGWETLFESQLNTGYSVNGCYAEICIGRSKFCGTSS